MTCANNVNFLISPFGGAGVVCLAKKLNITSWLEKGTFQISFYLTDNEISVGCFNLKLSVWSHACGFAYACMCESVLLLRCELRMHSNEQDRVASRNMMNYVSFHHYINVI